MFPRMDVARVPLTGPGGSKLRPKIVQASADGVTGFALLQSSNGFSPCISRGLLSDCDHVFGLWRFDRCSFSFPHVVFEANVMSGGNALIGNSIVQLRIHEGRITSLYDLRLPDCIAQSMSLGNEILVLHFLSGISQTVRT